MHNKKSDAGFWQLSPIGKYAKSQLDQIPIWEISEISLCNDDIAVGTQSYNNRKVAECAVNVDDWDAGIGRQKHNQLEHPLNWFSSP